MIVPLTIGAVPFFARLVETSLREVSSGKVEAGVLNASVWERIVEQKKVDLAKVRVFAVTPPYFDYNWTARGDLDPAIEDVGRLVHARSIVHGRGPAAERIVVEAAGIEPASTDASAESLQA